MRGKNCPQNAYSYIQTICRVLNNMLAKQLKNLDIQNFWGWGKEEMFIKHSSSWNSQENVLVFSANAADIPCTVIVYELSEHSRGKSIPWSESCTLEDKNFLWLDKPMALETVFVGWFIKHIQCEMSFVYDLPWLLEMRHDFMFSLQIWWWLRVFWTFPSF